MSIAIVPSTTYAYDLLNGDREYIQGSELVDRGDWMPVGSYVPGNAVTYSGALYFCLSSNTGLAPTDNIDDNWSVLVALDSGTPVPTGEFIRDANLTVFQHHINFGTNTDEVDATDIPYTNPTYITVAAALDALFYTAIQITSFTNNQTVVEVGATASNIALTWSLSATPISQSINQGIGSLPVGDRAYTHADSFTTSRTYTLTVSDGTSTVTASTSVTFMQKRYWGTHNTVGPDDADIRAMSQEFASSRSQSHVITAAGEYIFIAYPAAFGTASFTVNGLPNTAWTLSVQTFLNASGYSSSYNVYRSNNLLTGTYTIVVS